MNKYLEPEDDGLIMRPSHEWTATKLDYLKRYINIFETSMRKKPWCKRHYIDLFAGPGKCFISEKNLVLIGSPLIALTTTYPFTDYFFVDKEAENISALKQRCGESPLFDHIKFHTDDCNDVISEIVNYILDVDKKRPSSEWPSLNLAFIDPEGLELKWETLVTIAKPNRMDLIIHYPQMGLTREMPNAFKEEKVTAVDAFFGDIEWRRIYGDSRRKGEPFIHRQLMDFYKEKLKKLGYQEVLRDDEVNDEPLIRNAKTNAPLYRLIFASKHSLGHAFWRKVTRRDVHGQARLFN
jgi:three-Cys-motif partner protein